MRRLIGHDNDVQDVGWSYDSSILVSVGLDSKVVVWSGRSFEKLKTLSHHQSLVKGITFDPANKYFATASDDRTVRIFRFTSPTPSATAQDQANNFVLERTISAPFAGSPLTTYFRRCSWSPEGNHVAAANAVNGPVSSVAIISRGTWESDIHLIGHEGPVEVCAFSPRMFHNEPSAQNGTDSSPPSTPSVNVLACAGQDKTLSIWNTRNSKAFVITQELAEKSISDLSWSPDGERVFAVSLDGSIMAIVFDRGELGWPASLQENEKSLSKYGAGRKAGVSESTDAILLEDMSKDDEVRGAQGRMGELMGDVQSSDLNSTGITNNGTKMNSQEPLSTVPKNDSEIVTNGNSQMLTSITQTPQQDKESRVEKLKQRVTITKDGKKRIAPLLVSSSSGVAQSALPQSQLLASTKHNVRSDAPHNVLDLSKPYDGFPKGGLASLLIGNKYKQSENDENASPGLETEVNEGVVPIIDKVDGNIKSKNDGMGIKNKIPEVLRPAILNPSLSVSQVRLAVPVVRNQILRTSDASDPRSITSTEQGGDDDFMGIGNSAYVLEARNPTVSSRIAKLHGAEPVRMTCSAEGHTVWQDFLPRPVLLLTGNPRFWAAACEDGSLHSWTPMGRRLVNPLILEAQPVILDCRGRLLLCITAVGICHVWDMQQLSALHPPVSLAPILDVASHYHGPQLTPAPSVIFAKLNSVGHIIVGLSNGDGYAYSQALLCWQRLSEPWWAVGSQYWNTTDSSVGNIQGTLSKSSDFVDEVTIENLSAGIIPLLERHTTTQALLKGRAYLLQRLFKVLLSTEGFEGFESNVSIAHLENRLSAALTLGSREEFRTYLLMYAKRIGAEGLKRKVEELLRSISDRIFGEESYDDSDMKLDKQITSISSTSTSNCWVNGRERLCGLDRKELLQEVVLILGRCSTLLFDLRATFLSLMILLNREAPRAPTNHSAICQAARYIRQ